MSLLAVTLLILVLVVSWRLVYSANRDLVRVREWGELGRRSLPFAALSLMAISLLLIQGSDDQTLTIWAGAAIVLVIFSNVFSTSASERRANRAFRKGDYEEAIGEYRTLTEERPLARYFAFLSASLGAAEHYDEAVEASTQAVKRDPEYGIAYYNRALLFQRMGRRGRTVKDLKRALDADLPRRFRSTAQKLLNDLS